MEIVKYLEEVKTKVLADQQREIAVIKEKLIREKAIPHNQELDAKRVEAEMELKKKLDSSIKALQDNFVVERQKLIEVGEKNKQDYLQSLLEIETSEINLKASKAIAEIDNILSKIKE